MRVKRIQVVCCGPLPPIDWHPGQVEVIYDANECGKTSLVDSVINALFGTRAFPGADRYGESLQSEVTVEHAETELTFPRKKKPKNLVQWLDWREGHLARLLCVRAGELDLASREKQSSLMSALTEQLLQAGISLPGVQARVRDQSGLTGTNDWANKAPDYVKGAFEKDANRRRQLQEAVQSAVLLEGREREKAKQEGRRQELVDKLEAVQSSLKEFDRYQSIRTCHEATALLGSIRAIEQTISQDYARYRQQDVGEWHTAKQVLAEAHSLRDELGDLMTLHDSVERQNTLVDELRRRREEAERRVAEERHATTAQAQSLRTALTKLEDQDRRIAARAAADRLLPVGVGTALVIAAVFLATALLRGAGLAWLGVGVFGACGIAAAVLMIIWHLDRERARELKSAIRKQWSEAGIGVTSDDALSDALGGWERDRLSRSEAKLPGIRETERGAGEKLVKLRTERDGQVAAIERRLRAMEQLGRTVSLSTDEPAVASRSADQLLLTLRAELEGIQGRSNLATLEELKRKVQERTELEKAISEKSIALKARLRVDSVEAAASRIERLRSDLSREELDPHILTDMPDDDMIAEEVEQLHSEEGVFQGEMRELGSVLDSLEQQIDHLDEPLRELRVRNAADVYAQLEEVTESLVDRVRDRLAAIWAVEVLGRMQGSYRDVLDEVLGAGDNAACTIVADLTERYSGVHLDPNSGTFTVAGEQGDLGEGLLSDGARRQALLAIRLGLLQRLLGDEPGFLVLDDAFITFDDEGRKERAVRLMKRLVDEGWQVLYFTADATTRDLFKTHLGIEPRRVSDLIAAGETITPVSEGM